MRDHISLLIRGGFGIFRGAAGYYRGGESHIGASMRLKRSASALASKRESIDSIFRGSAPPLEEFLKDRVAAIANVKQIFQTSATNLKAQVDALERAKGEMDTQIKSMEEAIALLGAQYEQLANKCQEDQKAMATELARVTAELASVKVQLKAASEELGALRAQLSGTSGQLDDARARITELELQVAALRDKAAELETKKTELENKITDLDGQIEELKREKEELIANNAAALKEWEEKRNALLKEWYDSITELLPNAVAVDAEAKRIRSILAPPQTTGTPTPKINVEAIKTRVAELAAEMEKRAPPQPPIERDRDVGVVDPLVADTAGRMRGLLDASMDTGKKKKFKLDDLKETKNAYEQLREERGFDLALLREAQSRIQDLDMPPMKFKGMIFVNDLGPAQPPTKNAHYSFKNDEGNVFIAPTVNIGTEAAPLIVYHPDGPTPPNPPLTADQQKEAVKEYNSQLDRRIKIPKDALFISTKGRSSNNLLSRFAPHGLKGSNAKESENPFTPVTHDDSKNPLPVGEMLPGTSFGGFESILQGFGNTGERKIRFMLGASGSGKSFTSQRNLEALWELAESKGKDNDGNVQFKVKFRFAYGTAFINNNDGLDIDSHQHEWDPYMPNHSDGRTNFTPKGITNLVSKSPLELLDSSVPGKIVVALKSGRFEDDLKGLGAVSLVELMCQTETIPFLADEAGNFIMNSARNKIGFKYPLIAQTKNNPKSSRGTCAWHVQIGDGAEAEYYVIVDAPGNESVFDVLNGFYELTRARDKLTRAITGEPDDKGTVQVSDDRVADDIRQTLPNPGTDWADLSDAEKIKLRVAATMLAEDKIVHAFQNAPMDRKFKGERPEKFKVSDLQKMFANGEMGNYLASRGTAIEPNGHPDAAIARKFEYGEGQPKGIGLRMKMELERNASLDSDGKLLDGTERNKYAKAFIPLFGNQALFKGDPEGYEKAVYDYAMQRAKEALYIRLFIGALAAVLNADGGDTEGKMKFTFPFLLDSRGKKGAVFNCFEGDGSCSKYGAGMYYPVDSAFGQDLVTSKSRIHTEHVRLKKLFLDKLFSDFKAERGKRVEMMQLSAVNKGTRDGKEGFNQLQPPIKAAIYPILFLMGDPIPATVLSDGKKLEIMDNLRAVVLIPSHGLLQKREAVFDSTKYLVRQLVGEYIDDT
jgi:archaellum component FlaC